MLKRRRDLEPFFQEAAIQRLDFDTICQRLKQEKHISETGTLDPFIKSIHLQPQQHPLWQKLHVRLLQSYHSDQTALWVAWRVAEAVIKQDAVKGLITFWCQQIFGYADPIIPFWPRVGRGILITVTQHQVPRWLQGKGTVISHIEFTQRTLTPLQDFQDEFQVTREMLEQTRDAYWQHVCERVALLQDYQMLIVTGVDQKHKFAPVGVWIHVGPMWSSAERMAWRQLLFGPLAFVTDEKTFHAIYDWASISYTRTNVVPCPTHYTSAYRYDQQCTGKWLSSVLRHFCDWLITEEDLDLVNECLHYYGFHIRYQTKHDAMNRLWSLIQLSYMEPKPMQWQEVYDARESVWACPFGQFHQLYCMMAAMPTQCTWVLGEVTPPEGPFILSGKEDGMLCRVLAVHKSDVLYPLVVRLSGAHSSQEWHFSMHSSGVLFPENHEWHEHILKSCQNVLPNWHTLHQSCHNQHLTRVVYAFEAVTTQVRRELTIRSMVNRLYFLGCRRLSTKPLTTGPWIPHYELFQEVVAEPQVWKLPTWSDVLSFCQRLPANFHTFEGFVLQHANGFDKLKFIHYMIAHSKKASKDELWKLLNECKDARKYFPLAEFLHRCLYELPWNDILNRVIEQSKAEPTDKTPSQLREWFLDRFTWSKWSDAPFPLALLPHAFLQGAIHKRSKDIPFSIIEYVEKYAPIHIFRDVYFATCVEESGVLKTAEKQII